MPDTEHRTPNTMQLIVDPDYETASCRAADYICDAIHGHGADRPFVLGLPTGSSPLGTYLELVHRCRAGLISFRNVVTFNMDEYIGIPEDHPESYHGYMRRNLFDHIDIPKGNIHIPDGNAADIDRECRDYETRIAAFGGVDLFFSGVGHDGHIAFNVSGTPLDSRTHVQLLNEQTIAANARFFGGDTSRVPPRAITVGVATICAARRVLVIVTGSDKALALKHGVEGPITSEWTISALQRHADATIIANEAAASLLANRVHSSFKLRLSSLH